MALGRQLLQQVEAVALVGLAVPQAGPCCSCSGGAELLLLQLSQGFKPGVLLLQLFELALAISQLLPGLVVVLVQLGTFLARKWRTSPPDPVLLVGCRGFFSLVEGSLAQAGI